MNPEQSTAADRTGQIRVPNIAHFYCVGDMQFELVHALAILSAAAVNNFDEVILHCERDPTGPYWDMCSDLVTTEFVEVPSSVFGIEIGHVAHSVDVLRLRDAIETGGVFLDLDVLSLKSTLDLRHNSVSMAWESSSSRDWLGCAVMLCEPGTAFMHDWLSGWDPGNSILSGFRSRGDDEYWDEMSTKYAALLVRDSKYDVTTLPANVFYPFDWKKDGGLVELFEKSCTVPDETKAVHLWGSSSHKKYTKGLRPEDLDSLDSTFGRLARLILSGR